MSGADRANIEYRLGPNDEIRIIVYDEDDLSGQFLIDGSGTVALPLLGEIDASGLTTREFEDRVETAFRDGRILRDPRIAIEVLNFRPYYILGEVNQPGEYPYSNGLTVMKAVATANGFTYRANLNRVFIKRADEPGEIAYSLTTETRVLPGDTIRVAERYF